MSDLPLFLSFFEDSLILEHNDSGSVGSSSWRPITSFDEKVSREKNKHGIVPMYSVNAFGTTKEEIAASLARYKELRGADTALPKTPRFKENVKRLNAHYLDLDFAKEGLGGDVAGMKEAALLSIQSSGVPLPHLTVETKNGMQLLWLIDEPNVDISIIEEYVAVQEGIIEWSKTIGGYGDKVKDVCRYFRLPTFYHMKNPREPFLVTYKYTEKPRYSRLELFEFFAPFIPEKMEYELPAASLKISLGTNEPYFDLAEALNNVDVHEVVPAAFAAVGVSFGVDRDGYRWVIDGRLTGTFFSKQGKNIACSTSGEDFYSGGCFPVVIQIFKKYCGGNANKEALKFINATWGEKLRAIYKPVKTEAPIAQGVEAADELIKEIAAKDYRNYFSWMIPAADKMGGLLVTGRMSMIGGVHGVGKSTYLTELARFNALGGRKTMLVPLEMGVDFSMMTLAVNLYNQRVKEHFGDPAISEWNNCQYLSYGDVDEGFLVEREQNERDMFYACVREIYEKNPNFVAAVPSDLSLEALVSFLEFHAARGIKFFVVDHVHQLTVEGDSETKFYSRVAKTLKSTASLLDIALLIVVQLTKDANAGGDLTLGSFKGTSEFTSNAHKVVGLIKPGVKAPSKHDVKLDLVKRGQKDITDSMIQEVIDKELMEQYEENANVREMIFLKARGRSTGVLRFKLDSGQYKDA